jgi:hypothetical protein
MTTSPPTHRSVRQGSRPLVASTTARRSPSARMRPGAGFLPAWPPAARVLTKRGRAERFRVYGEDEFFAEAGLTACAMENALEGATNLADGAVGCDGRTTGVSARRCGFVLVGTVGAVGLVLVVHTLTPARQVRRKVALRPVHARARELGLDSSAGFARGVPRARPRQGRSKHAVRSVPLVGPAGRQVALSRLDEHARASAEARTSHSPPAFAPLTGPHAHSDAPAPTSESPGRRDVRVEATTGRPSVSSDNQGEFGFER